MAFGIWNVDVDLNGMPQKVATAFATLNDMVGAEYTFIAYLGSQMVNGTNHAVLAKQTIVAGKDTENVVIVFFRETKEGVTLSGIERVVEGGGELGGVKVDVKTDIPDDAQKAFSEMFEGYVGANVKPFALLATQMTNGINYIFVAEVDPVVMTKVPHKEINLVTVNKTAGKIAFVSLLTSKHDVMSLGYAFTWLRMENTSVGKPLGEWP